MVIAENVPKRKFLIMECCNMYPIEPIDCSPTPNEMLVDGLDAFSGDLRKAMKLLSKQCHVISFRQDPPEMYREQIIVHENPLIITYCHPGDWENEFEWKIERNELKQ